MIELSQNLSNLWNLTLNFTFTARFVTRLNQIYFRAASAVATVAFFVVTTAARRQPPTRTGGGGKTYEPNKFTKNVVRRTQSEC